jgi:DNA-binding transcriptional MerR regulator
MAADRAAIPNRTLFRAPEVCEIANVQPYVLRSWEAEFSDLGIIRSPGSPRVYRRSDVERVLQIKQLVFTEGLTLAGVRRRLGEPTRAAAESQAPQQPQLGELLNQDTRERLVKVKDSLRSLLAVLARNGDAGTAAPSIVPPKPAEVPKPKPVAPKGAVATKSRTVASRARKKPPARVPVKSQSRTKHAQGRKRAG